MQTIEELVERVRRNEEIARKLFDLEVQILNISHFSEYFERLLVLVKETFRVEYVWITLTDALVNRQILDALDAEVQQPVQISCSIYHTLTRSSRDPILVNQALSRYWPMMPSEVRREIASLAILPLVVDGKLLGSLNLGSESAGRYDPGKDNFFLRQLAVKAAISLFSVMAHEQVRYLASRDTLTHLRNRRELEETVEQELSRSRRHQSPLALVFIDCDDFKRVNDTYGHDCGDCYLKHVADCLTELIRRSDTAFRFAGDEFVLLLPNQSLDGAEVIAGRIREELRQKPLQYQGHQIPVRISYGVASVEELEEWSLRALLRQADERLYAMKALKPSITA